MKGIALQTKDATATVSKMKGAKDQTCKLDAQCDDAASLRCVGLYTDAKAATATTNVCEDKKLCDTADSVYKWNDKDYTVKCADGAFRALSASVAAIAALYLAM